MSSGPVISGPPVKSSAPVKSGAPVKSSAPVKSGAPVISYAPFRSRVLCEFLPCSMSPTSKHRRLSFQLNQPNANKTARILLKLSQLTNHP